MLPLAGRVFLHAALAADVLIDPHFIKVVKFHLTLKTLHQNTKLDWQNGLLKLFRIPYDKRGVVVPGHDGAVLPFVQDVPEFGDKMGT